jgi:peroxiredoxin Q/BCP
MHHPLKRLQVAALFVICAAGAAGAQQTPVAPTHVSPDVGALAPDFTLPAATRYGVLKDSIKLSDYRGKTVVLAFFFKARTKG